tara:strand:+ start:48 stop:626 length:579 start_codon:yes stop_codon:yes gene_type:complete
MRGFNYKKYLKEGRLLKENLSESKFKKDDKVKFTNPKKKNWYGIVLKVIENPSPKETSYELEMFSGRDSDFSRTNMGEFYESELLPFREVPKEESGNIIDVTQFGGKDLIISTEDGDIEGKRILVRKPIKTNPKYFNEYYFGSFPDNNTPAIQYIKSNIKTKESEGNIIFTLSTFKKWLKKEGIPFVNGIRR